MELSFQGREVLFSMINFDFPGKLAPILGLAWDLKIDLAPDPYFRTRMMRQAPLD